MDRQEIFRIWDYRHDSGGGSDPHGCRPYIDFVSRFIRLNGIKSVVDLGCGDFRVGSSIDYGDAEYTGVDASIYHIENHRREWLGREVERKYTFLHDDVENFDDSGYELTLMKDVIQHWPTENILNFLSRPHAHFMLITNDDNGGTVNGDIPYHPATEGRCQVAVRGLDLLAEPFKVAGRPVCHFNAKTTILVCRDRELPRIS